MASNPEPSFGALNVAPAKSFSPMRIDDSNRDLSGHGDSSALARLGKRPVLKVFLSGVMLQHWQRITDDKSSEISVSCQFLVLVALYSSHGKQSWRKSLLPSTTPDRFQLIPPIAFSSLGFKSMQF